MCLVWEGTPGAKSSWWAELLPSAATRLAPNACHPCPGGLQELAGRDPTEAPCPSARFSCPSPHWVQCTKPRVSGAPSLQGPSPSHLAGQEGRRRHCLPLGGPCRPRRQAPPPCSASQVRGRRLHMGTEAHVGGGPGGPGAAPGAPTESTRAPLASFSPSSTIWKVSGARASPAFTSSARFLRTLSLGIAFFACRGDEA